MARKYAENQPTLREHERALAEARDKLPPLAAAVGPDAWLRARTMQTLRDAWLKQHPDGDIATLRGAGEARQIRIPDIVREFSGGSLFSRDKLVIVRQADKILFPASQNADDAPAPTGKPTNWDKTLIERLDSPPPSAWLLLDCATLPRNRTLGKHLAQTLYIIPCPQPTARDIPQFLRDRANERNARLDDEAADLLIRAYGTDLGQLTEEVEKLTLFAPDDKNINADMVREFMTGSIEYDIFAFTNAVEARDARGALFYARRITSQGARNQKGKREDGEKTAHMVMMILSGNVTQLLKARVAMATGGSPDDFARDEKLSPWRAGKIFESASRFDLRELRTMASFMADQVRRSHDTGGDIQLALEKAAVLLTARRTA